MVEFWRDGVFVAAIYPHKDGIRIISKYMDGVDSGELKNIIPALVIRLSENPKC